MCRQKSCRVVTLPKFKTDFVKYRTVCEPSSFLNLQTTQSQWEAPTSELSRCLITLPAFCVLLLLAALHFVLCSTPTWKSPAQKGKHGQTITAIYWPQCACGPLLVVDTDIGPTPLGHGIDWDWVASLELMLLSWMWVCMCVLLFLFASMNVYVQRHPLVDMCQRSDILLHHSLLYSLEAGSLPDPRARLSARTFQPYFCPCPYVMPF